MSGPTMVVSDQPPDLPPAGADRDRPATCLLGVTAVIDNQTNSSTAYCYTDDNGLVSKIQVTFVIAEPPQISYICAYCTGSSLIEKPTIINTEGNLAVLYIGVAKRYSYGFDRYAFYVYHANGGSNGEPSLTMLPQPSGRRLTGRCKIGLLPGGTQDTAGGYPLHPHGNGHSRDYHVATLLNDSDSGEPHFELYVYSSRTQEWTVKKPVLTLSGQQQQAVDFPHFTSVVITVGGDYGTMGFVDFTRGILFCNVLQGNCPDLYYVPSPTLLHQPKISLRDAWRLCDIAVDTTGGRIRFVELCPSKKSQGWQITTWSRSAANYQEVWREDSTFLASKMLYGDLPEQLPSESGLLVDSRESPPTTIRDIYMMYTEFPTMSLHDDNTLYLMICRHLGAWDWWVITLDMENMTLQGVAHYHPEDNIVRFRHSNISNHLNMGASPGAKGYMKRPGLEVPGPPRKKQFILSMMDDMVSPWVGEQGQYQDAGKSEGDQYGDNMDLDMTTLLNLNGY